MSTSQTMTEKMNLAFSYFEQRKFDAALSLFEEVAEAQPTEIDAFIGIGKIRLERGEYGLPKRPLKPLASSTMRRVSSISIWGISK